MLTKILLLFVVIIVMHPAFCWKTTFFSDKSNRGRFNTAIAKLTDLVSANTVSLTVTKASKRRRDVFRKVRPEKLIRTPSLKLVPFTNHGFAWRHEI